MTKQEFISRLRAALNGNVSPGVVTENINYYEDYINTEIRKGKPEAEVLMALGDPRLIAKTIIETNGQTGGYGQGAGGYQESWEYSGQGAARENLQGGEKKHTLHVPGWVWTLLVVLVLVGILGIFFSVVSFLLPIILPIAVVIFLVKLFRDWLN